MRIWLISLLLIWPAHIAAGGAFPQSEGTAFLSTSGTYRWNTQGAQQEVGLYGTYGWKPRLTIGLDAYIAPGVSGHALMFLRLPLGRIRGTSHIAVEFGAGAAQDANGWAPMYRLSLSHGRGWPRGWYDLTASLERRTGEPALGWKLDGTLGWKGGARVQPMLEVGVGRTGWDTPERRVSAKLRIANRRGPVWVLGIERKRSGTETTGLSLALWRRF